MGGTSKQSTTQNSTTAPWEAAQPALQGILSQLQTQIGNSGLNSAQTGAIDQLSNNASSASQFAPQITNFASNLLNGGGATNQTGAINNAYSQYAAQTNPLASNTNYDPMQTPGIGQQLQTIMSDIGNSVNGQFAAAGRDMSGMNQQTLARGYAQGIAPVLTAQYNQNVANQQGAAQNLYNAGNTTSGLLSGLNQQSLANQSAGVTAAGAANDATNASANATLAAEAQRTGIPVQQLGLLAQIGIPIAGLGSQSTGQSDTTKTDSGWTQFGQAVGGLSKLFSDRRLKEEIEQVGILFDGTPVYRYRHVGMAAFQIGLMSDEVMPEAVDHTRPYDMVDYKLATDRALEAA
jgi:hypothetical protein